MAQIFVEKADLTKMKVDAIVNAANTSLLGGGGVDGAIHHAAGHELLLECKTLNGCKVGEAKITKGYKLPARYIIHTVGPIWNGGMGNESRLLHNAYYNSLKLAMENEINTIAFPNISTGVFGYPKNEAAKIAIDAVRRFLDAYPYNIREVHFVCFDEENYSIYKKLLD